MGSLVLRLHIRRDQLFHASQCVSTGRLHSTTYVGSSSKISLFTRCARRFLFVQLPQSRCNNTAEQCNRCANMELMVAMCISAAQNGYCACQVVTVEMARRLRRLCASALGRSEPATRMYNHTLRAFFHYSRWQQYAAEHILLERPGYLLIQQDSTVTAAAVCQWQSR